MDARHQRSRLALLPALVMALAGCGLKGPLYLPESPAQRAAARDKAAGSSAPAPAVPAASAAVPAPVP